MAANGDKIQKLNMEQSKIETKQLVSTYLPKEENGMSYPVNSTALLVIDPVNDFLSEGGAGYDLTKNTLKMNDVVSNLKRVIEGTRQAGIPVLFGPMAYTMEDYADEQLKRKSGINRLCLNGRCFLHEELQMTIEKKHQLKIEHSWLSRYCKKNFIALIKKQD